MPEVIPMNRHEVLRLLDVMIHSSIDVYRKQFVSIYGKFSPYDIFPNVVDMKIYSAKLYLVVSRLSRHIENKKNIWFNLFLNDCIKH